MEQQYYTREQITSTYNISTSTLNNWSVALRGTDMVRWAKTKSRARQLVYTSDFLKFLLSRVKNTGPGNLPDAERIATLYRLTRSGMGADEIASKLDENLLIIKSQLKAVGLEEDNG